MIERFNEYENVIYELADHIKKGCVYSIKELAKRVNSNESLDMDYRVIYKCISNHVLYHLNNGEFERVGRGQYKILVGRNDLREYVEYKCASRNGVISATIEDVPVEILDKDARINELENKLNLLAAAFCSVGRKLQESTDVNKILIETGQRVESVMS